MAKEKLKHPPGLYVLFGTEAAERFSFYTMRAILTLYLARIILPGAFASDVEQRAEIQKALSTQAAVVFEEVRGDLSDVQQKELDQALAKRGQDGKTFFTQTVQQQQAGLSAILDRSFGQQNLQDEGEKSFFANALASIAGDGKGLVEWVAAKKIKRVIRPEVLAIYGMYLLLVYLSGLIGGYVADKYLGSRKSIFVGAFLMSVGLFSMWWPSLVYYGLALLISGNAFFKPNISTIVSSLYPENDKRRDPAFTIFYMGINLGAFLAIFGAGYAEGMAKLHDWGWNIGFVLAGAGMLFSLALFVFGQRFLGTAGFPPGREVTADTRLDAKDWRDIVIYFFGILITVVIAVSLWQFIAPVWNSLNIIVQIGIGLALIAGGYFGFIHKKGSAESRGEISLTSEEKQRIAAIFVLSFFVIFFWAGFEQAGGTMNIFAYEQTDRHIFGWEMPATWFQGFNPFFILLLGFPFASLWSWNDKKSWGLSTPGKMAWGMIILGLGFVLMYFAQQSAASSGKAVLWWLVGVYLLHTIGELALSPIGLSMVTKLSPVRMVSLMMGIWFACTAVADYMSARMEELVHHFGLNLWVVLIASSIGAGIVLLTLTPTLKKWMHGRA